MSHLKGYDNTSAMASEEIRACRLDGTHFRNVMSRHVLHGRMGREDAVECHRLEAVKRLIWPQKMCEVTIEEDFASPSMHTEKGRFGPTGLNRYQGRPR